MIKSFFRSLETQRVNYLLISGQAAVLYGAAHFSEDIDLWVEPTVDNIKSFAEVLRIHKARYYKLTPGLEPSALNAGHGFHFVLPDEKRARGIPGYHGTAASRRRPEGTLV